MSKLVLMQGNEACVEGAIACGMRFFAGYPITPSTEIAERCALRLPMVKGHFIQMEDEIASMAAVIGASVAGVKSMTATSGPGFSLKQENIGYASSAEIPCVIVDVQRSGPSTGLPTSPSQGDVMQSKWGTHGDHPIIVLSPSSVSETYSLTIRAFNLSEKYRTPVIFLMDEMVGHLREGIEIPEDIEIINRKIISFEGSRHLPYQVPEGEYAPVFAPFGDGDRYNITGLIHDESGFPTNSHAEANKMLTRLMRKIEDNIEDIVTVEEKYIDDADIAVLCYGGTTRGVLEAIDAARNKGIRVGMFRPVTIWPFPEKQLLRLSKKIKKLIVAEHNYGQIVLEAERVVKNNCELKFIGRVDGTLISPNEILKVIEEE
ncbi:MAG: 2-oxoacid:acceptor oxidoreductase subunit alpha [Ruminiclostridium sp.]|nr:2-oxoacid:acceptor oxidoreductase subunit alpha [Ruminiclostridium sp.]